MSNTARAWPLISSTGCHMLLQIRQHSQRRSDEPAAEMPGGAIVWIRYAPMPLARPGQPMTPGMGARALWTGPAARGLGAGVCPVMQREAGACSKVVPASDPLATSGPGHWLLRTQVLCCEFLRARACTNLSCPSGKSSVDLGQL